MAIRTLGQGHESKGMSVRFLGDVRDGRDWLCGPEPNMMPLERPGSTSVTHHSLFGYPNLG